MARSRFAALALLAMTIALSSAESPLDKLWAERNNEAYYKTVAPTETFDNRRTNQYALSVCTPKPNTTFQYEKTNKFGSAIAEGVTRKPDELAVYDTADCSSGEVACTTTVTMLDVSNNLAQKWQTVVMNASDPKDPCYKCFNYPGGMVTLADGNFAAAVGPQVLILNGDTGEVIQRKILEIPTGATTDIVFNGLQVLPDGNIIVKNIGRPAGCPAQGYKAVTGGCAQLGYGMILTNATMVVLSPELEVLSQLPLPFSIAGRVTTGSRDGKMYVYVNGGTDTLRFEYKDGELKEDDTWTYTYLTEEAIAAGEGQASAVALMNDWAVFMTNAGPAKGPMSMHAVNLDDSSKSFAIKPFADAPMNSSVFPYSYAAAAISIDPETNMAYPFDFAPGLLAGYKVTDKGFEKKWEAFQPTSNFLQLIGPKDKRVIAGSVALDLPPNPTYDDMFSYKEEAYQFRDAATGELLAETEDMGPVFGIWHAPAFGPTFYYWSSDQVWKFSYEPLDPNCVEQEAKLLASATRPAAAPAPAPASAAPAVVPRLAASLSALLAAAVLLF